MAKFDLSKKKRTVDKKETDTPTKSKKRKVKRKKRTTKSKTEEAQQITLNLTPISQEWPPENNEKQILTWEGEFGWVITNAALANQHIKADLQMFGHSRVRYWAFLE